MLGVILSGGQSTRMGSDKGLIKFNATTWAQSAIDKMASLNLTVVLSVNPDQYNNYTAVFGDTELIKDSDELQVKGPMAGILSVHLQYPGEDLFVLACDMPLMEPVILRELIALYRANALADAYVFINNGEPEPLCSIYTAKGLSYIISLLKASKLTRHSLKYMLEMLHTYTVPVKEDQGKYFHNFNDPGQLNNL